MCCSGIHLTKLPLLFCFVFLTQRARACVSMCACVCVSVCLCVCFSVSLSLCFFVSLSLTLSRFLCARLLRQTVKLEVKKEVRERILRELRVLHRCSSPHIVGFFGSFWHEGEIHILMEYMVG